MTPPSALVVLGVVVALFIWNRLPVGVVAILAALGLWATGLVTTEEAVAGFGDPVVIFIATLFVVSEGIDSTGVTTWAGRGCSTGPARGTPGSWSRSAGCPRCSPR